MARSLLALLAGYLATMLLSWGMALGLGVAFPEALGPAVRNPGGIWVSLQFTLAFFAIAAGGYITAWVIGRSEINHAAVLGLVLIVSTLVVTFSSESNLPLWYHITIIFTTLPAVLLGAVLRTRKRQTA